MGCALQTKKLYIFIILNAAISGGSGLLDVYLRALETKHVANSSNLNLWEQGVSRMLYSLISCVQDHMLSYLWMQTPRRNPVIVWNRCWEQAQWQGNFSSDRRWIVFGNPTNWLRITNWRIRTIVTPLALSMSRTIMRWCKFFSEILLRSMVCFQSP